MSPLVTPVAALAVIAGARPERVLEIDRLMQIVHHVVDRETKALSCDVAPMDWWKAHWDWDEVTCKNCLEKRPGA